MIINKKLILSKLNNEKYKDCNIKDLFEEYFEFFLSTNRTLNDTEWEEKYLTKKKEYCFKVRNCNNEKLNNKIIKLKRRSWYILKSFFIYCDKENKVEVINLREEINDDFELELLTIDKVKLSLALKIRKEKEDVIK